MERVDKWLAARVKESWLEEYNQGVEGIMECSSSSDARKELDCHHPSPVSILEASFSIESCNSSDSGDVQNGGKLNSFSSIQAQNLNADNCPKGAPLLEAAEELSDSATSRFMAVADGGPHPSISAADLMGAEKQEMDYVKEILFNARLKELLVAILLLGRVVGYELLVICTVFF